MLLRGAVPALHIQDSGFNSQAPQRAKQTKNPRDTQKGEDGRSVFEAHFCHFLSCLQNFGNLTVLLHGSCFLTLSVQAGSVSVVITFSKPLVITCVCPPDLCH
jgi:hypothetical protein